MMRINRLKNIKVDFISLVKSPANKLGLILKGGKAMQVEFKKFDEDRQVAYGIVYAPEIVDSQGDFADRHEIEKAAYEFMKSGRLKNVDVEHSFVKQGDCYVCESWLVKELDPYFNDVGAWAVGIKVEDKPLWQRLKDGEITGLSMAGKAEKEEVQKDEEGMIKRVINAILKIQDSKFKTQKSKEEDMELEKKVEHLEKAVSALTESVKTEEITKAMDELKGMIGELRKSFEERLLAIEKARVSKEALDGKNKSDIEDIL